MEINNFLMGALMAGASLITFFVGIFVGEALRAIFKRLFSKIKG